MLSIPPVLNMLSPRQIMNTSFDPLDLVNTYGAFGSVGRERLNVVFEGTMDETPDDERELETVSLQGPARRPRQTAAAGRPLPIAPGLADVVRRDVVAPAIPVDATTWSGNSFTTTPAAVGLFADNPFPDKPPRYIRAVLYRYSFAPPGNPDGLWWNRERVGDVWLPALSADDPRLIEFLKRAGWIPEK